jgi:8-oxo-dGTP pyrophosphatase MutT (NUDIX family)
MANVEEAGAIVVRRGARGPEILLVTAKRNRRQWIFPKGHVEEGETLEEAGVREAHEEAGVRTRPVAAIGSSSYQFRDHRIRVHYFLLTTKDKGRAEKKRSLKWLSYDDALDRLTFDGTKRVLRKARRSIRLALRQRS